MNALMTTTNKQVGFTPAARNILVGAAVAVISSFVIGGYVNFQKMDKLTERLTYSFEQVTSQVKTHDIKLEEIDRRIRVLELEVALSARGRR